jgi:hypothetical protein
MSANGDGGGTWQPTPTDEAFIGGFCNLSDACCAANGEAVVQGRCQSKLEQQGLSRDQSLRSACLARLQQLASTMSCLPELETLDDPCVRILDEPSGPLRPGQNCARNADCAGSPMTLTICSAATTPEARMCVRANLGLAGDHPCLGTMWETGITDIGPVALDPASPPVATGFVCPYRSGVTCNSTSHACVNALAAGQSCTDPQSICDMASYCDTSSGTCTPRLTPGSACGGDNGMCLTDSCVSDQCSTQSQSERLSLLAFCSPV